MRFIPINSLEKFGALLPSSNHNSVRAGDRFGDLEAVSFQGRTESNRHIWLWRCACGNYIYIRSCNVKSGASSSCGCLNSKLVRERQSTHGLSGTPEYHAWRSMISRCLDPDNASYHRYGGRGITIDTGWIDSFESFLQDMGYRPSADHSLEREDTNRGYCKDNCHWATRYEQTRNRTSNQYLRYRGEIMTIMDFSRKIGCDFYKARHLLKTGRTPEEISEIVASGRQAPRLREPRATTSLLSYEEARRL